MKTAESDSAHRLVFICKEKTNYVQCGLTSPPSHEKQVTLKLLISMKTAENDSGYRLVLSLKRKQSTFNVDLLFRRYMRNRLRLKEPSTVFASIA